MFKKDEVRILIATSVAARGLDVKNVNLVCMRIGIALSVDLIIIIHLFRSNS